MELYAIRHIKTQGYLQLDSEMGNYLVSENDAFFTTRHKPHCENGLDGTTIYVEDEGELNASELEIVKITVSNIEVV